MEVGLSEHVYLRCRRSCVTCRSTCRSSGSSRRPEPPRFAFELSSSSTQPPVHGVRPIATEVAWSVCMCVWVSSLCRRAIFFIYTAEPRSHRSRIRILWVFFKFTNFTEFKKMPTDFYFKIQYFNFDWKIIITLLHGHRNTQQWQVRLKSVLFRVRISNSPLLPFNNCFNIVHNLNVLQFNHNA